MFDENLDRRRFLQGAGLAVGAGAVLPVLGAQAATASDADPDQLLREARFEEAERGFKRLLRKDPNDAHAAAQLGYIALLSNRFEAAERFLTRAVTLAPDDAAAQQQLGDCYVRQDRLDRAVAPLRAAGNPYYMAQGEQYASMTGEPWQVHGAQQTRLPFLTLDPLPAVVASVNGAPKRFLLDTGATTASLSTQVAQEAGLRAVSTATGMAGGQTFTMYFGVLESFRMGDIELCNIPVHWNDARKPPLPDGSQPDGVLGTWIFYHFLTTLDYANQALILRRKDSAQLRRFRAEAMRACAVKLPLWLGGDHFPCTLGSLLDFGPKVVSFDTGGPRFGIGMTVAMAEQLGIEVDYDHPERFNNKVVYPITPERISLGRAVGRDVRGLAGPLLVDHFFKFRTVANFTHEFFKPFAITLDFTDMNLYITGDSLVKDR